MEAKGGYWIPFHISTLLSLRQSLAESRICTLGLSYSSHQAPVILSAGIIGKQGPCLVCYGCIDPNSGPHVV